MKDLAPNIMRKRLLLEGFYNIDVNEEVIRSFFSELTNNLGLKVYGEAIIFSPSGMGKEENQGYDAFIPLIDSGISLYIWCNSKFLSMIIYTCKNFDEPQAKSFTRQFFGMTEQETLSF